MPADRLPELFARAFELGEEERANLVDELGQSDPALAAELALLLASADSPASPLDRSQKPRLWGLGDTESGDAPRPPLPERIGAYRIVGELGRGGMGRVFLAEEQTSEFRRTVALKVIDRPGPDDDAIRRFRDEVRILASLEHPGIARFLDGGRTPDGTWFLALERVEGESLVAWAAARELAVRARIELFLAVLEAVQFAHEKGIVHRDLKPAHLLVGVDGRPRLLDFGISKLVDQEAGEGLTVTRTEARAMTPAYASPEQFRGEPATRVSDIYSLGVILYELLAGRRPFADSGESRGALERAVLGTEPEPPSRAARVAAKTGGSAPSTGPPTAGRPLGERLGRDLDAICLKALRKEPGDRYPSAALFSEDLRRFLDGRPVAARRGGLRYRASRFVARRSSALLTAAALVVAIAAVGVALDARRRSSPAPPARPTDAAQIPKATGTETIAELERRFAAHPASLVAGTDLASELRKSGRAKEAAAIIARVRQLPGGADDALVDHVDAKTAITLGEHQRALALNERALANAVAQGHGDLIAAIRLGRARNLKDIGQSEEADAELARARDEAEKLGDDATLTMALNNLASEANGRGELEASRRFLEEALVPARRLPNRTELAITLANLAEAEATEGRPDLAVSRAREATALLDELGRTTTAALARTGLASDLYAIGKAREAAAEWSRAIAVLETASAANRLCLALGDRADADFEAGRFAEVEAVASRIESVAKAGGFAPGLAIADRLQGKLAWARGDSSDARKLMAESLRLQVEAGELLDASAVQVEAAGIELAEGDPVAAERMSGEAIQRLGGGTGSTAAFVAATLEARSAALSGRSDDARVRIDGLGAGSADAPHLSRRIAYLRARAALALGERRFGAARTDLEAALAAAEPADRTLEALEIRNELVRLARSGGAADAEALASAMEERAAASGLTGFAAVLRRKA